MARVDLSASSDFPQIQSTSSALVQRVSFSASSALPINVHSSEGKGFKIDLRDGGDWADHEVWVFDGYEWVRADVRMGTRSREWV